MADKKYFWSLDSNTPVKEVAYTKPEKAILNALKGDTTLSRDDLILKCKLRKQTFLKGLKSLVESGVIDRHGKGTRGSRYTFTASKKE